MLRPNLTVAAPYPLFLPDALQRCAPVFGAKWQGRKRRKPICDPYIRSFLVADADALALTRPPGLLRRLSALLYDLILLFGMLLLAATLVIVPASALTGHEIWIEGWPMRLFQLYLVLVGYGFFAYFWRHGGQTLGMRSWRFRLVRADGQPLTAADVRRRLLWSTLVLAPLGLFWVPFDPAGLAPHDRLSATQPRLVPK